MAGLLSASGSSSKKAPAIPAYSMGTEGGGGISSDSLIAQLLGDISPSLTGVSANSTSGQDRLRRIQQFAGGGADDDKIAQIVGLLR